MASFADYQRDYWSPDREEVLAQMQAQQAPPVQPGWGTPGAPVGGAGSQGGNRTFEPMPAQANYGGGGGGAFDEQAIMQAWLGSGGRTLNDWHNFVAQHPEIQQYVTGSKGDKLSLPGGVTIDAVYASGLGGQGAQWNREGPGGGGGADGYGSYGGNSAGRAPNATPFSYDAFVPPDQLTLENDPGYKARLALGLDAVEKSAASRGTLLTGGTMKDLNQYAQDYGSQEFQNVYDRALNAYKTNFESKFKPWEANYNAAYQSWLGNYNAAQQGWMNNQSAQQQRYGQLYNTAQLGLQGTNGLAGAAQTYGQNQANIYGNQGDRQSDLLTGQGNANAAGQIGQGNANANMWTGLGNTASMAGLYSDGWNQRRRPTVMPGNY